jgi:hypothetical protein
MFQPIIRRAALVALGFAFLLPLQAMALTIVCPPEGRPGTVLCENGLTLSCSGSICCVGTSGDDFITGRDSRDVIIAGAGSDSVNGKGGDDHIYGCAGGDGIDAGSGRDYVNGGSGVDTIFGSSGNDILRSGPLGNGDFLSGDGDIDDCGPLGPVGINVQQCEFTNLP